MTSKAIAIIGGVDTHAATHQVAVIDDQGRLLGTAEFPATNDGYAELLGWLRRYGTLRSVGVEGTGAYGAGLARHLHANDVEVLEVPRPDRRLRRQQGKSDPIDAEAAARAVLAGTATAAPKFGNGPIEAVRALRLARSGAIKACTAAKNSLIALVVTAPELLRSELSGLTTRQLVITCSRLRPDPDRLDDPVQAVKAALRSIARRANELAAEANQLERQLAALTEQIAPATTAIFALGPDTAAALLVSIGDNPDRLVPKQHLRGCAASHPFLPPPARPTDIASTEAETAPPTGRSTSRSSSACATAPRPMPTLRDAPPTGCRSPRSSAASSATSPERSSPRSDQTSSQCPPDIYRSVLRQLLEHVDVERLVRDQPLQPGVLALEFLEPFRVVGLHAAVLREPAMPRRLRHPEMTAHLVELLTAGQQLVALSQLPDDLLRRMPPALLGHRVHVPPRPLSGIRVAQHLDHNPGLTSPAGQSLSLYFRFDNEERDPATAMVAVIPVPADVVVEQLPFAYSQSGSEARSSIAAGGSDAFALGFVIAQDTLGVIESVDASGLVQCRLRRSDEG